jgi:hypothetical protein
VRQWVSTVTAGISECSLKDSSSCQDGCGSSGPCSSGQTCVSGYVVAEFGR